MNKVWLPACLMVLLGCGHPAEQFVLPDQVTDFSALYQNNCAGCHGRDGRSGCAANRDARLRAECRRHADGRATHHTG
jgi:mono/diheme cytochrome c family protein